MFSQSVAVPFVFLIRCQYRLVKSGAYGVSRDKKDIEYLTNVNLKSPIDPECGTNINESILISLILDLEIILYNLRRTLCGTTY